MPVDLGGPRQRALLAVLLAHPNEPVGADALMLVDRPIVPGEALVYDRLLRLIAPARERLGEEGWASVQAAGRVMTADEAIAYALQTALLPG